MQQTSSSSFYLNVKKKIYVIWEKKYEDCQMILDHVFDKQFLVTVISRTCKYVKISLSILWHLLKDILEF